MNVVLDKNGNQLQVMMYCYPAKMWVLSSMDDVPVACSAVSMVNGVGFEWEDDEYQDYNLLQNLHKAKTIGGISIKDKEFILYYHEADYFVGVTYPDNVVTGCVAIKQDGEMFCRWRSSLVRGSITSLAWAMGSYSKILSMKYLSKGITKLFGIVAANNVASNRYHVSVGARIVDKIEINGVIFNKYEQDIADAIKQAESVRHIWDAYNIGDFDNPSVLIQDEVYA